MFPARGERIERKAPPKTLMQAQIGPPLFFNTSPRLSRKKCQPISPRSGEEHDASNQDVSRSRMPPIIRPERVAYFHVELDSRDVIVAEGPRSWKRATKTVPRLPMPIGQKPSLAPTRQRERQMKQFKSASQAQRFLSAHDQINNLFHFRRDHVTAAEHRTSRTQRFRVWAEICSVGWQ